MTRLRLFIVAVAYTLLAVLTAVPAAANEALAPETQGLDSREAFRTGTRFFDEAEVSGGLYFFRRDRRRYDVDKGPGTGRTSITPRCKRTRILSPDSRAAGSDSISACSARTIS